MSGTVRIQTLRGEGGLEAALKSVQGAVDAHNVANPKAQHIMVNITALARNTKGMQWQLALLATLARKNGANMIRLSVHGGDVALCGPAKSVEAVRVGMIPAHDQYVTLASATYNPAKDGKRVGWSNGFLCGCPAGLQDGLNIQTALVYGVGFFHTFEVPGNGVAYDQGYKAALALVPSAKVVAPRKPQALTPKQVAIADEEASGNVADAA